MNIHIVEEIPEPTNAYIFKIHNLFKDYNYIVNHIVSKEVEVKLVF